MSSASTTAAKPRVTDEELLASLDGTIPPVRLSPLYAVGMGLAAAVMLVLPLVYVGMIGLVGWGVWWHATHDVSIFRHAHGGGSARFALLVYVAPIVAGVALILFMVKPLFARRRRGPEPTMVTREQQPLLFAFVERLCTVVGAPRPRAIHVDCDVNASASLGGLLSRHLTLTIGLPLAAGLSLREFAGVLAHEFGHFSQGLGMRLSYMIRAVNDWFARVVYGRDAWDEQLVRAAAGSSGAINLVIRLVQGLVWLTRRILWLLMMCGHGVSCFLMRRMEFDADQYEVRIAGSQAFASTSEKLPLLGMASMLAHDRLEEAWRERRLADNLPRLILWEARQAPSKVRRELAEKERGQRTKWYDTHPATADRVAAAQAGRHAGLLTLTAPATALFREFDELCRRASFNYYQAVLPDNLTRANLAPTEVIVQQQEQQSAESRAQDAYFGLEVAPLRPLRYPESLHQAPAQPRAAREALREARAAALTAAAAAEKAYAEYDELERKLWMIQGAELLCRAKIRFNAKDFEVPSAQPAAVADARHKLERRRAAAAGTVEQYEQLMRTRLRLGLELLQVPAVQERLKDGRALRAEVERLTLVLVALDTVLSDFCSVLGDSVLLHMACEVYNPEAHNATIEGVIRARTERLLEFVELHRPPLRDVPYPFEHAAGKIDVAHVVLPELPTARDPGTAIATAREFVENVVALYRRLLGRLASIAGRVEKVLQVGGPTEQASPEKGVHDAN